MLLDVSDVRSENQALNYAFANSCFNYFLEEQLFDFAEALLPVTDKYCDDKSLHHILAHNLAHASMLNSDLKNMSDEDKLDHLIFLYEKLKAANNIQDTAVLENLVSDYIGYSIASPPLAEDGSRLGLTINNDIKSYLKVLKHFSSKMHELEKSAALQPPLVANQVKQSALMFTNLASNNKSNLVEEEVLSPARPGTAPTRL